MTVCLQVVLNEVNKGHVFVHYIQILPYSPLMVPKAVGAGTSSTGAGERH